MVVRPACIITFVKHIVTITCNLHMERIDINLLQLKSSPNQTHDSVVMKLICFNLFIKRVK